MFKEAPTIEASVLEVPGVVLLNSAVLKRGSLRLLLRTTVKTHPKSHGKSYETSLAVLSEKGGIPPISRTQEDLVYAQQYFSDLRDLITSGRMPRRISYSTEAALNAFYCGPEARKEHLRARLTGDAEFDYALLPPELQRPLGKGFANYKSVEKVANLLGVVG